MNNKEISLIVLLVFGVLTLFASFKMHLNLFSATGHSFDFFHHTQKKWTKGALFKDIVLHSGVCPFGKFGAWANFLWSFLLIGIILVYKDSKDLVAKETSLSKSVHHSTYSINYDRCLVSFNELAVGSEKHTFLRNPNCDNSVTCSNGKCDSRDFLQD